MNITLDLNDSFIFKESPEKDAVQQTPRSVATSKGGAKGKVAPFMLPETTDSGC